MSAPDFYFALNAIFRHLHDEYGMDALVDYWRQLGRDYYRPRTERWREGGLDAVAADWREYFGREPRARCEVRVRDDAVELDVQMCPAIAHLRAHRRDIVSYFCEHCDHVCGAMATAAGFTFERTGGMGSCRQRFAKPPAQREPR